MDNIVYLFGIAMQIFLLLVIAQELHSIKKVIEDKQLE